MELRRRRRALAAAYLGHRGYRLAHRPVDPRRVGVGDPGAALALLAPVVFALARRSSSAVVYSSLELLDRAPRSMRARLASIPAFLLALGTPLAWWLASTRRRVRPLVEALVALPIVLPPTVLGFYLLVLLGPEGAIGAPWISLTGEALPLDRAFTLALNLSKASRVDDMYRQPIDFDMFTHDIASRARNRRDDGSLMT